MEESDGACCPCNRSPRDDNKRSDGSPSRGILERTIPAPNETLPGIPPHWGPLKQLYCRTRFNLSIDREGKVYGAPEAYHPFAILHFTSVAQAEVRIQGVESKLYLAMNSEGNLYGEEDRIEEGTIFVEGYDRNTGYNTYLSRKYAHHGWYVGIKKSGKAKPGPRTNFGQKAIQFLPRQARPSGME